MKRNPVAFGTLLLLLLCALHPSAATSASLLIEAEDFQFVGGWHHENAGRAESVARYLIAQPSPSSPHPADAATAIRISQPGRYAIWVHSKDYASFMPRTRRYRVAIDGTALAAEGGRHGREGWAWERLGEAALSAGEHLLSLHHINSMPRCDAVVLTTDPQSPASWNKSRLAAARLTPIILPTAAPGSSSPSAIDPRSPRRPLAQLENEFLKIAFESARDTNGREIVIKTASLRLDDGRWAPLPRFGEDERLFLLHTPDPGLKYPSSIPRNPMWRPAIQAFHVTVGGKEYQVHTGATDNPFLAAQSTALAAVSARQVSPREVEINYQTATGQEAIGRWSLAAGARHLRFSLTLAPKIAGYYSVGLCAFPQLPREQVAFVQLPPLYQFQRLPESPVLISSAMTPQPLVLVQGTYSPSESLLAPQFTCALIAEPEALPFVWPHILNAPYGFSLLNAARQVQPCGFSPVLGFEGSRWDAGKPQTISWRLYLAPGDWKLALERISTEVMELRDYRRPLGASLTEAALNMIDLMLDADHGGWDEPMKSFFDIETQGMGKHAAPLVLLSVALLTRDERFWRERALPTLEFTLSRRRSDFIDPARGDHAKDGDRMKNQLEVPTRTYGTSYWQGVHELLMRLNPWLEEFILPGGQPAPSPALYSPMKYAEWLAAWRYKPDPAFLQQATREADDFLKTQVYGPQTRVVGWMPFYNISFYPQWWNLLDLYEATGEARYREAAVEGAFHTIAGLWSHPRVPQGDITVHAGGSVAPNAHIWSRDGKPYRLGWPRRPGDTPDHAAPAWTVAQAGLGLEQPSTYAALTTETGMRNIMNATWAPHLLRAYQATGREIFRTYARNAVIGRFASYPGYYLSLFTDFVHDPQYPQRGPDITSFYYHHIPVHLGFTLDYLAAEAAVRSAGRVRFPYVTQKDYAWFNNRVYGTMPGEVFGDKEAALWLDRAIAPCRAVEVDWLAARSPRAVHLMLMNQLREPVNAPLTLNIAKLGLKQGAAGRIRVSGDPQDAPFDPSQTKQVTIPALGMVTLTLPATAPHEPPLRAALRQGHLKRPLGGPWGELHAFRIRSPFGSDALYVALTGEPAQGARASLRFSDSATPPLECNRFPYEFSVYPLPEGPVEFSLRLEAASGEESQRLTLTLGAE